MLLNAAPIGVLAKDLDTPPTVPTPCPAIVAAILAAIANAPAGSEVSGVNFVASISLDATTSPPVALSAAAAQPPPPPLLDATQEGGSIR
jgi:hypothetical protein